jgi:hypothetical protein
MAPDLTTRSGALTLWKGPVDLFRSAERLTSGTAQRISRQLTCWIRRSIRQPFAARTMWLS